MNDCEAEAEDDRRWSTNSDEEFVQCMDSRMALEASQQETEAAEKLVPRVRWRILPMLWVLSFVSYIDRANLAYVSLKMNRELGFDTTTYGIGAALFFVGYARPPERTQSRTHQPPTHSTCAREFRRLDGLLLRMPRGVARSNC